MIFLDEKMDQKVIQLKFWNPKILLKDPPLVGPC